MNIKRGALPEIRTVDSEARKPGSEWVVHDTCTPSDFKVTLAAWKPGSEWLRNNPSRSAKTRSSWSRSIFKLTFSSPVNLKLSTRLKFFLSCNSQLTPSGRLHFVRLCFKWIKHKPHLLGCHLVRQSFRLMLAMIFAITPPARTLWA